MQEGFLSGQGARSEIEGAWLPTVGEPGTREWCEEVVACLNSAWRSREAAERAFLAAARTAIEHRIWETLSPPAPEEPYTSLDSLIRHIADPNQAEPMQIAIRFSNVRGEPAGETTGEPVAGAGGASASSPPWQDQASPDAPSRPLTEAEEIADGNARLARYMAQAGTAGMDVAALRLAVEGLAAPGGPPPGETATGGRRTAAQRKRDRLERVFPDLAQAVDAGEMTLKQAYIEAGIEKEVSILDKLQKLWRNASEAERDRFVAWLDGQEG